MEEDSWFNLKYMEKLRNTHRLEYGNYVPSI